MGAAQSRVRQKLEVEPSWEQRDPERQQLAAVQEGKEERDYWGQIQKSGSPTK